MKRRTVSGVLKPDPFLSAHANDGYALKRPSPPAWREYWFAEFEATQRRRRQMSDPMVWRPPVSR